MHPGRWQIKAENLGPCHICEVLGQKLRVGIDKAVPLEDRASNTCYLTRLNLNLVIGLG